MTSPAASSYELKRFVNAGDPDFAAALAIYVRNTPPSSRTDTNEIAYWLERFDKTFNTPFYVFGFYRNGTLIGYAEAAYFLTRRLLMLDYLVLDVGQRGHNVFFEFVDQLRRYLEGRHPEYQFAVAEITYGAGRTSPSAEALAKARLMRLQGFRVIPARYVQPRLYADDADSEALGNLLIHSAEPTDTIRRETYLQIVRTIYFEYYLKWMTLRPGARTRYRTYLDELLREIETSVGTQTAISMVSQRPTQLVTTFQSRPPNVLLFATGSLLVVVLVAGMLLVLQRTFGLTLREVAAMFGATAIAFVGLAGIVSANARKVFREIATFARQLLRRPAAQPTTDGEPIRLAYPIETIGDDRPTLEGAPLDGSANQESA